jgi:hypothetical protein
LKSYRAALGLAKRGDPEYEAAAQSIQELSSGR